MEDNNVENVLASNGGMSYFDRQSSGDIGNQNLNVGGGYGSSAWGGNGTDGKEKTINRIIPLNVQSANHRVIDANISPINARKKMLMKEGFQKDIRDVDMSSLRATEPNYILKERFGAIAKDAADVSISLIAILIVCIVIYWLFVKIYVKSGVMQWDEYDDE